MSRPAMLPLHMQCLDDGSTRRAVRCSSYAPGTGAQGRAARPRPATPARGVPGAAPTAAPAPMPATPAAPGTCASGGAALVGPSRHNCRQETLVSRAGGLFRARCGTVQIADARSVKSLVESEECWRPLSNRVKGWGRWTWRDGAAHSAGCFQRKYVATAAAVAGSTMLPTGASAKALGSSTHVATYSSTIAAVSVSTCARQQSCHQFWSAATAAVLTVKFSDR